MPRDFGDRAQSTPVDTWSLLPTVCAVGQKKEKAWHAIKLPGGQASQDKSSQAKPSQASMTVEMGIMVLFSRNLWKRARLLASVTQTEQFVSVKDFGNVWVMVVKPPFGLRHYPVLGDVSSIEYIDVNKYVVVRQWHCASG